ncbi:hypothetical protein [Pseudanabaena sp. UWO310]|nr:hypothetical protein [Pseudanabaena sp. UWO310]
MLKHFLRRSPFSSLQIKGDRQNPQANQNSDRFLKPIPDIQ